MIKTFQQRVVYCDDCKREAGRYETIPNPPHLKGVDRHICVMCLATKKPYEKLWKERHACRT